MDVIKICEDFISNKGINDIEIIEVFEANGNAMFIELDLRTKTREIYVNCKSLEDESLHYNIDIEDYTIIVLCHELGHYKDGQLEERDKAIRKLQAAMKVLKGNELIDASDDWKMYRMLEEKVAWKLGEQFVPDKLKSIYRRMHDISLELQEDIYELDRLKALNM